MHCPCAPSPTRPGSVWLAAPSSITNALDGLSLSMHPSIHGDQKCSGVEAPRPLSSMTPGSAPTALLLLGPKAARHRCVLTGRRTIGQPPPHVTFFLAQGGLSKNTTDGFQSDSQVGERSALRRTQREAGGGPHPYGGLPAGVPLKELGCCIFEGLGTPDLCTQSRKEPRVPRSPHDTHSCRQVSVA